MSAYRSLNSSGKLDFTSRAIIPLSHLILPKLSPLNLVPGALRILLLLRKNEPSSFDTGNPTVKPANPLDDPEYIDAYSSAPDVSPPVMVFQKPATTQKRNHLDISALSQPMRQKGSPFKSVYRASADISTPNVPEVVLVHPPSGAPTRDSNPASRMDNAARMSQEDHPLRVRMMSSHQAGSPL
ncbi:unnamed protein product [Cuscuta campestris]|uniref:Uncharacterized protein n=1 Tax=Cuscuta campestris TaxID=132261 RepID=A0A484KPE7_9ASTE|nr:unnamed protein product [Cuscuta campestris]